MQCKGFREGKGRGFVVVCGGMCSVVLELVGYVVAAIISSFWKGYECWCPVIY